MKYFLYYKFFRNFSNPLRLRIILLLRERDRSVSELVKAIGAEQSKISHHLALLAGCRIIDAKRKGKYRIYSLNKEALPLLNVAERCVVRCRKGCKNAKNCLFG